ncbi:hypothetical protein WHR41_03843 [Cladosporium halotolerans]|uniref:Uncharacterized protein n=1 Tax=Cladosporium halotolerans TaxID=1052096 RepID=A0AB34KQP1_9PEZI
MCNGTSSRTSQGGSIAVLQPKPSSQRPQLHRELSLRLAADAINGHTTATFEGLEASPLGSYFVIHRDGDLVTGSHSESSILHRFAVPQTAHQGNAFDLNQRLDLGVGGDGVIGRRVSFVNEQTVLGEGIIGWN